MKNISKIVAVLIMALTVLGIYSCQKDAFTEEPIQATQEAPNPKSLSLEVGCGDIPELCRVCVIETHEEKDKHRFMMNIEGESYEISPVDYFSDGLDFALRTEKGNFVMTNTRNSYVQERSVGSHPVELEVLYRLDAQKLMDGTYTQYDIERDLGTTVRETTKGVFEINVSGLPSNPNTGETGRIAYLPEP